MAFSSSSDVWAYGVTLWEIFTLVEVPWVQHEFNAIFVEKLKQGMRLTHPQNAPSDMYAYFSCLSFSMRTTRK